MTALSQNQLTLTLAQLTWRRLISRKLTLFLALAGLTPCLVLVFWVGVQVTQDGDASTIKPYELYRHIISLYFLNFYLPFLALLLGLGVMSEEIESKNLTFTLVRPLALRSVVLGRFLGYYANGVMLLVLALVGNFFANMLFQIEDFAHAFIFLIEASVILSLGFLAQLAVIALMGTYWRRFALLLGIIWLIFDNLFSRIPVERIQNASALYHMFASFREALPFHGFTASTVTVGQISMALLYWGAVTAGAIALMVLRLRNRELVYQDENAKS